MTKRYEALNELHRVLFEIARADTPVETADVARYFAQRQEDPEQDAIAAWRRAKRLRWSVYELDDVREVAEWWTELLGSERGGTADDPLPDTQVRLGTVRRVLGLTPKQWARWYEDPGTVAVNWTRAAPELADLVRLGRLRGVGSHYVFTGDGAGLVVQR